MPIYVAKYGVVRGLDCKSVSSIHFELIILTYDTSSPVGSYMWADWIVELMEAKRFYASELCNMSKWRQS